MTENIATSKEWPVIGQRFGRLTVVDDTPISINWKKKYKCLCDCDTEVYVPMYSLKTGHKNSCGNCGYRAERAAKACHITDYTDQKFGKLTAIKFIRQDKYKRAIWEFKCDCGNTYVGPIYNVRSGNTKSCGCAKHRTSSNALNLVGETFGRLTVLEKDRTEKGITYWKCLCTCGKEVVLPTGRLRSNHTKSCGCLLNDIQSKDSFNSKWSMDLRKLYNGECQKCGSKKHLAAHHLFPKNLFPALKYNPINGIVLCGDCHRNFHHLYGYKCRIEDIGEFLNINSWNISIAKLLILLEQKGITIDDCKRIIKLIDDKIKMLERDV